jgi:hypothetical protein
MNMFLLEEMTRDDLLEFNDQCMEAMLECPNVSVQEAQVFEDRDILRGEVTAEEVIGWWSSERTLWEYGYDECLDLDAVDIIKQYRVIVALRELNDE